ncbi:PAS domain-containing protein [Luteimonas sp. A277]
MGQAGTILLVDDTRSDAALYSALLRRASNPPREVEHAQSLEAALRMLESGRYAAVLLDLGLPDCEELQGLEAIVGRYPELPVVVLTGRDEDLGERAIAAGAQDYLRKSEAKPAVIDRALRLAQARQELENRDRQAREELLQSRRQLAESERRYRDIFDHSMGLICTHSLGGMLLSVNPAAAEAFSLAPEALVGRRLHGFVPAAAHDQVDAYLGRIHERGADHGLVPVIVDGELRIWRYHNRLIDREGEQLVLGLAHDVTDRQRIERELRAKTAELEAVNDAAPLGLMRTDAQGRCTYVNRTWQALAGVSQEQALGNGWLEAVHPEDRERVAEQWERTWRAGEKFSGRQRYMHIDGRTVWCTVHASPMIIDGRISGYFATVQDLTREHLAELARRRGDRRLATLADALPLLLMFVDRDMRVEFINSGWTDELQRSVEQIIGQPLVELISNSVAKYFAEGLERARAGVEHSVDFDDPGDTAIRTWNAVFIPQRDQDGHVDGVHVMLRDVTLEKAHRQELVRRAEQDPLTGTFNRAGFEAHGGHAWKEAARQGRPLGVFFFDLDDFKEINDSLGHASGDGLLQEVATRVRESLRADDIIGRLGGDEFAVIVRHVSDAGAAETVAAKLIGAVSASTRQTAAGAADQTRHASCSLGYYIADAAQVSLQQALQRADQAQYAAKRAGKGLAVQWQARGLPQARDRR